MRVDYKNASTKDLKAEWLRVSKSTGSEFGHRRTKELEQVVKSLLDNEAVIAISDGQHKNKKFLVAVTSHRLLVMHSGILSGVDETEFKLNNIIGVDVKSGLVRAKITIKTPSSPVMKSLIDQSVSGATMITSIAGLPSMFATMAIARAASN